MYSRVDLEPDPESATHANGHDYEQCQREFQEEFPPTGINAHYLF